MAELNPAPFRDLVTRLYREPSVQGSLFDLARRHWYVEKPSHLDFTVRMHGRSAGNPLGPAAGPHTQMAQNLLLSYVAGARILELKTVQVNDALDIPRPCIDVTNIGYNVEWSQELKVDDSLREYVAGAMLIEMFRAHEAYATDVHRGGAGDVIYDMSVGYDLAGIQGEKVRRFIDGMKDASAIVAQLRDEIPKAYAGARDIDYPVNLSGSITLSTFHGCPADEIERICEFLLAEHDVDVIVKMNPPTLGKERLEHLLFDTLGYTAVEVVPHAYSSALTLDESVQLCDRLVRFGADRERSVGFKFSNTLEVRNHRKFFTPDNEVMYLSGQPLHVITMTLTDVFRKIVGPDVPISFSAGVDARNFADTVACGFVPITVSTDLLRPGGYGRLSNYLKRLAEAMDKVDARTIDAYVLNRFESDAGGEVRCAGVCNTSAVAKGVREDPRYRADRNGKTPVRIDSHLEVFDCITCDKCIPVCPNDANFTYPTPIVAFDVCDLIVQPDGSVIEASATKFEITEKMQIACYADFCNECGNCDTFCPEYGGPYIKKPSFFGSVDSWRADGSRDGFVVNAPGDRLHIMGRFEGIEYELSSDDRTHTFSDDVVEVRFSVGDHAVVSLKTLKPIEGAHRVRMNVYHSLLHLRDGVLDRSRVNQINAGHHEFDQSA